LKKYKVLLPSGEVLLATDNIEEAVRVAEQLNLRIKVVKEGDKQ